ncbi:MAG: flagellar biosynthetic protein FliP [Gammaproteobacteria bacterium]|jgi:flagellar biosynthetic protein FliP
MGLALFVFLAQFQGTLMATPMQGVDFSRFAPLESQPIEAEAAQAPNLDTIIGDEILERLDAEKDGEDEGLAGMGVTRAVEIALLLTALSLLPAMLITLTSFTRIVIVLSFVRRALAVQELPPNPILIGLALFLTTFIMGPVVTRIHTEAYAPYKEGTLPADEAASKGWGVMREFLLANTRESELVLFAEMADLSQSQGAVYAADGSVGLNGQPIIEATDPDNLPFRVVVPAFILSELKTAFQMGFLLFLPFLVIDLVIASVLISMGMFMLPPVMISTPFKILLFVLVDGWHLVCESRVNSFVV